MNDDVREKFDALDLWVRALESRVTDLENGQIPAVQAQTVDDAPEPTMYEGRLSELRRERDQAQLNLADVRGNYGRLVRERDVLAGQVDELDLERRRLSSELSNTLRKNQDRIRELETRHSGLHAANRDLNRQLSELSSKHRKMREDLGARNMELAKEVDRLRGVVATDSVRQDQVRQINDLLAERVDLKAEVARLRDIRVQLYAKLTKIRAALD